jgi:peroxiredoxin
LGNVKLLGKPTVMTLLSTWAPPARDQLSILNQLDGSGLNIVPVGIGEDVTSLKVYNDTSGFNLPILADSDQQLVAPFGVSNMPTTYFVNRQGVVKKVMLGVLSKEEIINNVQY